ncbi:MAG: hypothetical protein ACP5GU_08560 [Thermoprotei archaeon]
MNINSIIILFLVIMNNIANVTNSTNMMTNYNSSTNPYKWIENKVNSIFSEAESLTKLILTKVFYFLLLIARLIYISLALGGILEWFTGISPYKGRRMIIGAAIIALAVEFINTFITSL